MKHTKIICGQLLKHSITRPITDPSLVFHYAELFEAQTMLFIFEIRATDLDSHLLKFVEGN